jgi:hypothetical protein
LHRSYSGRVSAKGTARNGDDVLKRFLILSFLVLSMLLSGCFGSGVSSDVDKKTIMPGNNVVLIKDCFGAVSKDVFDKLSNYTTTQNVQAAEGLRQNGQLVVLHTGDRAELEEVTMTYVKMKMLTGILQGRSIYTFREMVEKATSNNTQSNSKTGDQTANNQNDISRNDVNDGQRKTYNEWINSFDNKISGYQELDVRALKTIDDFKAKKISKSSKGKVEDLWNQMDTIRMSLIDLQTPKFSAAIDKQLWKISGDYCSGVNDRQAALWKIIEYTDGVRSYDETMGLVNDCVKTSDEFFDSSKKIRTEFTKIFE